MNLAILEVVMRTYPERPVLDAREWPYSRDELERLVDATMRMIERLFQPEPMRYWPTLTGRVIRIPNMKPLLKNGKAHR